LKKRILTGLAVVIVVIAIALPTALLIEEKRVDTEQVVRQSFALNYGARGSLTAIQRVKDLYVVQWQDTEGKYTMLYVDGLWLELGPALK